MRSRAHSVKAVKRRADSPIQHPVDQTLPRYSAFMLSPDPTMLTAVARLPSGAEGDPRAAVGSCVLQASHVAGSVFRGRYEVATSPTGEQRRSGGQGWGGVVTARPDRRTRPHRTARGARSAG